MTRHRAAGLNQLGPSAGTLKRTSRFVPNKIFRQGTYRTMWPRSFLPEGHPVYALLPQYGWMRFFHPSAKEHYAHRMLSSHKQQWRRSKPKPVTLPKINF